MKNIIFIVLLNVCLISCKKDKVLAQLQTVINISHGEVTKIEHPKNFGEKLSNAAIDVINPSIIYKPDYVSIQYPNGDVPAHTGVCTDVVIRAFRRLEIDLQKDVHEDMNSNFSKYPNRWGLNKTDTNIDHRRVPNLEVFFKRKGKKIEHSENPDDYLPGDIVTWNIGGKMPHIGIVTHIKNEKGNPLIVHNAGWGQVLEDCLYAYPRVGLFRY